MSTPLGNGEKRAKHNSTGYGGQLALHVADGADNSLELPKRVGRAPAELHHARFVDPVDMLRPAGRRDADSGHLGELGGAAESIEADIRSENDVGGSFGDQLRREAQHAAD